MLIDSRTILVDTVIDADICIVGAGPAGITLAREFLNTGLEVCLLESGDFELDSETQKLSIGTIISQDQYPLDELEAGRQRGFGGASCLWHVDLGAQVGVRYAPLDPIDFQKRDWFPYSGWSISYASLLSYYKRAQQICEIGPFRYDSEPWITPTKPELLFKNQSLETTIFQFGPRDIFSQQYKTEILQSPNVSLYLYANVTQIATTETANQVTHLSVACLNGNTFTIKAQVYVLAMGGIETARLLLASNQTQSQGLGNQHDLVGRFYMDHLGFSIGSFYPSANHKMSQMQFYDLHRTKGVNIAGKLSLSPELIQQEKIVNTSIWMFPRPKGHESTAVKSLKHLMMYKQMKRQTSVALKTHVLNVLGGLDDLAAVAYRKLLNKQPKIVDAACGGWSDQPNCDRDYSYFDIATQVEQIPNPSNRITLGKDKDALGLPRVILNWQWSSLDLYSLRRTQQILQAEIAQANLGVFRPAPESTILSNLYSAHHHMGVTRMHLSPQQGVVDPQGQVHGICNLFIAGSSIFPTGGYANPTLTVIALALRLADHIKKLKGYS